MVEASALLGIFTTTGPTRTIPAKSSLTEFFGSPARKLPRLRSSKARKLQSADVPGTASNHPSAKNIWTPIWIRNARDSRVRSNVTRRIYEAVRTIAGNHLQPRGQSTDHERAGATVFLGQPALSAGHVGHSERLCAECREKPLLFAFLRHLFQDVEQHLIRFDSFRLRFKIQQDTMPHRR